MPPKTRNYTEEQLIAALAEISDGVSYAKVSAKYKIPTSTLHDKAKGKYNLDKSKPGPATILTHAEELRLVAYLKGMSAIGHSFSHEQLKQEVTQMLDARENSQWAFKENFPSRGWIFSFLKRHEAEFSSKSEEDLRTWFLDFKGFLMDEHGIIAEEFFVEDNANRIFNCDECSFPLAGTNSHKSEVIIDKEQITVLATASADGYFCKPMVLHTGTHERFTYNGVNIEDYYLGRSKSGRSTADNFFEYITKYFYPELVAKGVEFPIILLFNGHKSCINISLAAFCRANQIIPYCFQSHASHVTQPLDISVFGPLKSYYNSSLKERAKVQRTSMSKRQFIEVFDVAWKRVKEENVVRQGFRKCGIMPFDANVLEFGGPIVEQNCKVQRQKEITLMEKVAYANSLKAIEELLLSNQQVKQFQRLVEIDGDLEEQDDVVSINTIWDLYKKIGKLKKGLENISPPPPEVSLSFPPADLLSPKSEKFSSPSPEDFHDHSSCDFPPSPTINFYSLSPKPSTSTAQPTIEIDSYNQSGPPCKKLVKIQDNSVPAITVKKKVLPYCISADKSFKYFRKKQKEKLEKEKRDKTIALEERKKLLSKKGKVAGKLIKSKIDNHLRSNGKRRRKNSYEDEQSESSDVKTSDVEDE